MVVNGKEITLPELNFALNSTNIPENVDKTAARSQILQQLIDRRLLAEQARQDGIDKTPEYLNRQIRAEEDLLISMLAARRLNTAQLPSDRETDAFIASHPGIFANRGVWIVDQIQYLTPSDKGILGEIQGTKSLDQLIAVLQKHSIKFERQKNGLDTASVSPVIYKQIQNVPPGEPFILPVGDRSVASAILGKEARPLSGSAARPAAVALMRKSQTTKSLEDLTKALRSSAKIDYKSGYAPKKANP